MSLLCMSTKWEGVFVCSPPCNTVPTELKKASMPDEGDQPMQVINWSLSTNYMPITMSYSALPSSLDIV